MAPNDNFWEIMNAINNKPLLASDARVLIKILQAKIEVLDPYTERKYRFPSYSVTVDYNQTVEKLIENGKYNFFDEKLTSCYFPSNESGVAEVNIYLLSLYESHCLDDSIDGTNLLDYAGLRPATLKELLALGSAYPDLQRTNPIVALGSELDKALNGYPVPYGGYLEVPYLDNLDYRVLLCWKRLVFMDSSWQLAAVAKDEKLTKK